MDEIRSRDDLPALFNYFGYRVGVEIGVYKGEFTEKLCNAGLKVYGIDPYLVYPNYRKHPGEPDYEEMYQAVSKLLESHGGKLIRKMSMDALSEIPDGSLDFVYIDGNHSIRYAVEDIYEWQRKVRRGGIVSGHDYFNSNHNPYWIRACHVKDAVDVCVRIFGVTNLQVIEGKDRRPSWYWIKQYEDVSRK